MNACRFSLALTAATGGVLAAASLSLATAAADTWTVSPDFDVNTGLPPSVISETGMPPFYQDVLTQGAYEVIDTDNTGYSNGYAEIGGLLSTTNMLGMTNADFVVNSNAFPGIVPTHSVIDIANFGGGFENQYVDLVGLGANGSNEITDTVITPFGNFDIPTTFDAAAFGSVPAAATDALAASTPADDGLALVTITAGVNPATIVSENVQLPFYESLTEQGTFTVTHNYADGALSEGPHTGTLDFTSILGVTHEDLIYNDNFDFGQHMSVLDIWNFGPGYESVYEDVVYPPDLGGSYITDTLITPFGDLNIPMSFDAAAFPAAATDWLEPGAFTAALEADWASLVALF
jgi:hypothetical protein